jgi:hypothetical protein
MIKFTNRLAFASTIVFLAVVAARPLEARASSINLLTNGDAESGQYVTNNGIFQVYSTPGWTIISGEFCAELYSQGTLPNMGVYSPGPPDRGTFLFYGGNAANTVATQSINVSAYSSMIDAGSVLANVSGWLGGYYNQEDFATFSAIFRDTSGNSLGSVAIGPLTAADRGNVSSLLFCEADAWLPVGTRTIEAELVMTRVGIGPFNNGAADNLNISLTAVPEPASFLLLGTGLAGIAFAAWRRKK